MTRNEKLLNGLNLQTAVGIEIGALDKPIIPPLTPHVFYVDHLSTEMLRSKYQHDPYVDVDKLVQVHGVWGEASLAQAAARVVPVDFVVASHVAEHVPDLVSWLREVSEVLSPGGSLRLAVPDRRYTFDILRRESLVGEVLTDFVRHRRTPSGARVLDFALNMGDVDCAAAWRGELGSHNVTRNYTVESALALADDAERIGIYHDVHCWVFTPLSFAVLMHDLANACYQPFKCVGYFPTEYNTNEFFVTLELCGDAAEAAASWKLLQQTIETQLDAQARELREAHARAIQALEAKLRQAQTQVEVAQAQVHDAHAREALLRALRLQDEQAAVVVRLALADRVAASEVQIAGLTNTVALMRASTSWRVTAPVRAMGAWLKRARLRP